MRLYPFVIPSFVKFLYPNYQWSYPNDNRDIFLTFDDGPHPNVTPWVLDILLQYHAKGTFFVVGENAKKYPELIRRIRAEGHEIGNHTHTHISGYAHGVSEYLKDVEECQKVIKSRLFRPPYGRIKSAQGKLIRNHYQVVMWNQLSGDFDKNLNTAKSLKSLQRNSKGGNIVVFHDSEKAYPQLKNLLEPYLRFLKKEGFNCKAITGG